MFHLSVTFFSFFNRGGREEGTESAESYMIILCVLRGYHIRRFPGGKLRKVTLVSFFHRTYILPDGKSKYHTRHEDFPFFNHSCLKITSKKFDNSEKF